MPTLYLRAKLCEVFQKSAYELGFLNDNEDASPETYTDRRTSLRLSFAAVAAKDSLSEVPESSICYGRETELETIVQWIVEEHCHLILLTGISGIGKTCLAIMTAERTKLQFDFICWYSLYPLHNPPPLANILQAFLEQISNRHTRIVQEDIDSYISLLIRYLQQYRCLLILDNFESVLQEESHAGTYRREYKEYARFIQRVTEARHQSCLLLASQEQPDNLGHLAGKIRRVRFLQLRGLKPEAGRQLLQDEELIGSDEAWTALIQRYGGNPLALKLASPVIQEIFGRDIAAFLHEDKAVFGGLHTLLENQFLRLSQAEQEILFWLAIEQEQVSLSDISEDLVASSSKDMLLEALISLRRRSMVEKSAREHFFLQPIIMEYVTKRLIELMYKDIMTEQLQLLSSLALIKAQAPNYLRHSQINSILRPLVEKMCIEVGQEATKSKLFSILSSLRTQVAHKSRYAAGNILNMLVQLQANLRGANFSFLPIHHAYLQEIALSEVNLAYSDVSASVFAYTLGGVLCVKFSPNGELVAIGTTSGEILLCRVSAYEPLIRFKGHADAVRSIDFHPLQALLMSGSVDQTVRFWDTTTGECIRILLGHTNGVRSVVLSPDGRIAASGSGDRTIRLWEVKTGNCLSILSDHPSWVEAIAFSPDGNTLASSSGTMITLWDIDTSDCLKTFQGHRDTVRAVAFSPDGTILASSSKDWTIRLWDTRTSQCLALLEGHHGFVRSIAFSSDGTLLATGSDDQTIRLWNIHEQNSIRILQGHYNRVWSIAFSPNQQVLVSGSEDQTVRFWDSNTGHCTKTLQGYNNQIWSVAFHTHHMLLASGNDDHTVSLWDANTDQCVATLYGHTNRIRTISFSSDGRYLASGSEDRTIRVWDSATMQCTKVLTGHTHLINAIAFSSDGTTLVSSSHDQTLRFWSIDTGQTFKVLHNNSLISPVAFSNDGNYIATCDEDHTIQIWEVHTGQCIHILQGHTQRIWTIAFSLDRQHIASSDDQIIRLWDLKTKQCINVFQGHTHLVRALAFSPDGLLLASGSHDQTVRLWSVQAGQCLGVLQEHTSWIWSICFSYDGATLASGCHDGSISLWNMETYQQIKILRGERPYEGMNITGTTGLTPLQKNTLKALGAIEYAE